MKIASTTRQAPPHALAASLVASMLVFGCGVARAADEVPSEADPADTTGEELDDNPSTLEPDAEFDEMVRVVQRRPVLKANRFELLAGAGLVLNDAMYDHWLATATGRFHISEWISVGATYGKFFATESELQRAIADDFDVYPELSAYRWYAGADVSLVAVEGKFVMFDDLIAYWDFYVSLGGGAMVTSRADSPKPSGLIGAGFRLFLGEWLTVTLELRDHMLFEKFRAGHEFVNNLVGQAGLSIFIPFGFDYEYAK